MNTKNKPPAKKKTKKAEPARASYDMPAPNDGLVASDAGLGGIRLPAKAGPHVYGGSPLHLTDIGPLGAHYSWIDPRLLEHFLDADPKLQTMLAKPLPVDKQELAKRLQAVASSVGAAFQTTYIDFIKDRFGEVRELIAQYMLAKAAWERARSREAGVEQPVIDTSPAVVRRPRAHRNIVGVPVAAEPPNRL